MDRYFADFTSYIPYGIALVWENADFESHSSFERGRLLVDGEELKIKHGHKYLLEYAFDYGQKPEDTTYHFTDSVIFSPPIDNIFMSSGGKSNPTSNTRYFIRYFHTEPSVDEQEFYSIFIDPGEYYSNNTGGFTVDNTKIIPVRLFDLGEV